MPRPAPQELRAASRRLVHEARQLEGQIPAPRRRGGRVLKRCPNGEPAWLVRRKVLRMYGRALRLDPQNAEAYVWRGLLFHQRDQPAAARADMRQALALRPRRPDLYSLIAIPFGNAEKREVYQRGLALCREDDPERHHLQFCHDLRYWYDRDYERLIAAMDAEVTRLEHQIATGPEPRHYDHRYGSLPSCCGFLQMGYAALGRYAEVERTARRLLPYLDHLPDRPDAPAETAEDIIRARMHANDFPGALAAVEEFAVLLPPERRELWEALLHALANGTPPTPELVRRAEADRYPPGGQNFLLGVFYTRLGRPAKAATHLRRLCERAASNPREWGVTLRWEVAQAQQLLAPSS